MMETTSRTKQLVCLVGAVVLGGLLAGVDVVRLFVEMPAWRHVGATAWADFSRHADLGNGFLLFPVLGIGDALFSVVAAIAYRFGSRKPRAAAAPLYAGTALTIAGMVATGFAAPQMLSLRSAGSDGTAIQRAFDGFELWGGIRSAVQTLAFLANVWALVAVASHRRETDRGAPQ